MEQLVLQVLLVLMVKFYNQLELVLLGLLFHQQEQIQFKLQQKTKQQTSQDAAYAAQLTARPYWCPPDLLEKAKEQYPDKNINTPNVIKFKLFLAC